MLHTTGPGIVATARETSVLLRLREAQHLGPNMTLIPARMTLSHALADILKSFHKPQHSN